MTPLHRGHHQAPPVASPGPAPLQLFNQGLDPLEALANNERICFNLSIIDSFTKSPNSTQPCFSFAPFHFHIFFIKEMLEQNQR